jgi:hypothetical protein
MKFKEYPKVYALHKDECEGILEGLCHVQEKVDGANASIWFDKDDNAIHFGSRSRDLYLAKDNFNGFGEWVSKHPGLPEFFDKYPNVRLNGEWLVRHTIGYNELSYKKFYLFDMMIEEGDTEEMIHPDIMYDIAPKYNIPTVALIGNFENPTIEDIKAHAGYSVLGEKGEGVVIKNLTFINKYGSRGHAKYVTQEFKEDNAVTFGGNNKHSEAYEETYYMNKFMTLARVQKVLHKLESAKGKLSEKNIPEIMGTCYHDVIAEEGWTLAKEMSTTGKPFNFKTFKSLCDRKSKSIFLEVLSGDVSVANL